jgi:hypothetical protein
MWRGLPNKTPASHSLLAIAPGTLAQRLAQGVPVAKDPKVVVLAKILNLLFVFVHMGLSVGETKIGELWWFPMVRSYRGVAWK